MRIMFMSSRQIGEDILRALVARGEEVVGVASPRTPPGGKNRMKQAAEKLGIPHLEAKNARSPEFFEHYAKLKPDLNVMARFRVIVPESILNYPRFRTIGWHPSLLPKYAGVDSLTWAIIFGETKTANTILWTDRGIDTGPILLQKEVVISPDDTSASLYYDKISPGAVDVVLEAVELIKRGNAPRIPQDLSQYSYYSFITEQDSTINWIQPGRRIYDLIRGANPHPGATTNFGSVVFKILDTELRMGFDGATLESVSMAAAKAGGVVGISGKGIETLAPDGVILIKSVQFDGAKLQAAAFAERVGLKVGDALGALRQKM